ncbi:MULTISPECIES: hypothetical protein [unclassified Motilimonas]|uniref:hypothetical protein n=1 Tax=unclassified Motilimonas TaxID=2643697 RepID=UPI001E34E1A7|nr:MULTISPECIES: hypothetical protein [unclassified Motilimonas]MCE0555563.1 hypothetical protein [Motilimonas sp. E26]MDO6527720.1 hypothetical protein [Motilimonas sp. 1_MG-2023]
MSLRNIEVVACQTSWSEDFNRDKSLIESGNQARFIYLFNDKAGESIWLVQPSR